MSETSFEEFEMAAFVFESTSYDWLAIAGDCTKYKGAGMINEDNPSIEYGFMLTACDNEEGRDTAAVLLIHSQSRFEKALMIPMLSATIMLVLVMIHLTVPILGVATSR